ncbi:MAG TPA: TIGR00725 family protein [Pyrinomonadaceae bacterium]|nr:TIGR00725 family protein [Pyrinomonadaceae bacterium]
MGKTIVGVMGPGEGASEDERRAARELGALIAAEGWVLLTGGRACGVMEAASRGAREAGGLTIGVLPTEDAESASEFVDLAVVTGMGQARNQINVLTSRVVFACGAGAGTASEIALALKARKPVILLRATGEARAFFASLGRGAVRFADGPREAVEIARAVIGE